MRATQKEINERIESFLNERWFIANMEDSRPQDMSYYNGALKALEFAGYDWRRDADGEHRVFKSKQSIAFCNGQNKSGYLFVTAFC